jgi:glycosyltransferase involved in cell wall biosynthesis
MNDSGSQELFSIVTPSFNQANFLEDTLRSVWKQNYPKVEHWVIDGGSDDKTIEILERFEERTQEDESYQLKWVSEPDRGQSHAINKGFERAGGSLVGWLNSDDMYFDTSTLEAVARVFERTDIKVVYGDDILVGPQNTILRMDHKYNYSRARLLRSCYICQPALFLHQDALKKFSLNESLEYVMDYEFWLRLSEKYDFYHLDRILAMDRNHPDRKMLVHRDSLVPERESVQKSYGQTFGVEYWMGRLLDKVYSAWNRLRGASTLKNLDQKNLTVPLKVDNWWSLIRRQLFSNNEDLI